MSRKLPKKGTKARSHKGTKGKTRRSSNRQSKIDNRKITMAQKAKSKIDDPRVPFFVALKEISEGKINFMVGDVISIAPAKDEMYLFFEKQRKAHRKPAEALKLWNQQQPQAMEIHPIAELLPPMTAAEFEALKLDIEANGLRDPIAIFEEKILDGRHRYRACAELNRSFPTYPFNGTHEEAVKFVYSKAVHRNLTESQKAASAVGILDKLQVHTKAKSAANLKNARPWVIGEVITLFGETLAVAEYRGSAVNFKYVAKDGNFWMPIADAKGSGDPAAADASGSARDQVGKLFGISGKTITDCRAVRDANRDLFNDIFLGRITVASAKSQVRSANRRAQMVQRATALPSSYDPADFFTLMHGDNLKVMKSLPRRKARQVVADSPYNLGIDYGDGASADQLPPKKFLAWCCNWMSEAAELLTPDGSMWLIINDEWAAEFVVAMKEIGMHQRGWIKWYETFGVNCTNQFNRTSRHALYFVKDPDSIVFNPEAVTRESDRQAIYGDKRANPNGKIWDDVWIIPRLAQGHPERIDDFPTQLPKALMLPIVAACTEPGDTVIDIFNGSGTTGAACIDLDRKYIGIDKSKTFLSLSNKRLLADLAKRAEAASQKQEAA